MTAITAMTPVLVNYSVCVCVCVCVCVSGEDVASLVWLNFSNND